MSTSDSWERFRTPHAGDPVVARFDRYPWKKDVIGRLDNFGSWKDGEWHVCCEGGSVFLFESGRVSISGGPFACVKPEDLVPTLELHTCSFWNWGDNGPGANHGVYYQIDRPLFEIREAPKA